MSMMIGLANPSLILIHLAAEIGSIVSGCAGCKENHTNCGITMAKIKKTVIFKVALQAHFKE